MNDLDFVLERGIRVDFLAWMRERDSLDQTEVIDAVKRLLERGKSAAEIMEGSPWAAEPESGTITDCFSPLDDLREEPASWLVDRWIPEGQVTILAADGGVGKTTLWCNLAAALSSGTASVLDSPGVRREPLRVLFFSAEDSVKKKLRRKLREAGADLHNIICADPSKSDALRRIKFGSPQLEAAIRAFRPALCIFDPLQGYVPPDVNMGSRNAMRDCIAPLVSIGEETGTSFLIVCHSNKRKGASGRDRIADSADLWDIARSVLMSGFTNEPGIRYLSQEKNNYDVLQQSILYSISDAGEIVDEGRTWKRDRDYQMEKAVAAPSRHQDCEEAIIMALHSAGGRLKSSDLEQLCRAEFTAVTIRRTKEALKEKGVIGYESTGFGNTKVWYTKLLGPSDTFE